jgi:hypothetical protein
MCAKTLGCIPSFADWTRDPNLSACSGVIKPVEVGLVEERLWGRQGHPKASIWDAFFVDGVLFQKEEARLGLSIIS